MSDILPPKWPDNSPPGRADSLSSTEPDDPLPSTSDNTPPSRPENPPITLSESPPTRTLENPATINIAEDPLSSLAPVTPPNTPTIPLQIHTTDQEVKKVIRTLRHYARWTYPQLQEAFGISLGTLHRIIHAGGASAGHLGPLRGRGRRPTVTPDIQLRLIETATASSQNRRLPYTRIAELAGIQLGEATLKNIFKSAGYHRRVAREKPFLSLAAKEKRMAWGERFRDWGVDDWADIIWSDECAFSVGDVCGTTWVTRRPEEEYHEDCLVPRFPRLTTVMVWGAIYRDQKGPLVVWDTANWGRINGPTYIEHIIRPYLFPWWQTLHQAGETNSGYIYFQQDNAPAHRARYTLQNLNELGLGDYLFPWPASSPDMSPIEAIWCSLKRRISRRSPRPTTVPDLKAAIFAEWENITPAEIAQHTTSPPHRVSDLLAANGGHTSW